MPSKCFVCDLPILSHQVGLVWQGCSGVDDFLREQMEMVSPFTVALNTILTSLTPLLID